MGVNDNQFQVLVPNSGVSTEARFDVGSYIQIGNEIMKVELKGLTGTGNNEIRVIRGALGTISRAHASGSLIRKIDVRAVEYRRPSIIRCSGHTFEYLGFGPGNYSTSLPQVQVRTLTEKEEFLSQSQQRSAGTVVYTGMNNKGDFYIGNKKINSATGKEKVFGIPVPTITGVEPSELSVIFDDVTVKQRIFVEGGNNNNILSQFNGPVNFSENVKLKGEKTTVEGTLQLEQDVFELKSETDSTSTSSGALVITGGVGIGKSVNIGGKLTVGAASVTIDGTTGSESITVGSGVTVGFDGINVGSGVTITTTGIQISGGFVGDVTGNVTGDVTGNVTGNINSSGVSTITTLNNTTINKVTITQPASSATLTIANGKTLSASNTVTLSGTDGATLSFGSGGTVAYNSNKLSFFNTTSSSELKSVISDETGSGSLVFGTDPTISSPTIVNPEVSGLTITDSTLYWKPSSTTYSMLQFQNASNTNYLKLLTPNSNPGAGAILEVGSTDNRIYLNTDNLAVTATNEALSVYNPQPITLEAYASLPGLSSNTTVTITASPQDPPSFGTYSSFNIKSYERTAKGYYTIYFEKPTSGSYVVVATSVRLTTGNCLVTVYSQNTNSFSVRCQGTGSTDIDPYRINIMAVNLYSSY